MNEKTPVKPKVKHSGVLNTFIFFLFKTVLINALAWLLLFLWFIGESFMKGAQAALQQADMILGINTKLIEQSSSYFNSGLNQWFSHIEQSFAMLMSQPVISHYQILQETTALLITITEIDLTRLFIFLSVLPLFAVTLLVAATDGLVKRDIRKFKGARESTLVFHRCKHLTGFCFFSTLLIYLSTPAAVSPMVFLSVQMILVGVIVWLSVTYFKKYL